MVQFLFPEKKESYSHAAFNNDPLDKIENKMKLKLKGISFAKYLVLRFLMNLINVIKIFGAIVTFRGLFDGFK